jgi:hypothetical protein
LDNSGGRKFWNVFGTDTRNDPLTTMTSRTVQDRQRRQKLKVSPRK